MRELKFSKILNKTNLVGGLIKKDCLSVVSPTPNNENESMTKPITVTFEQVSILFTEGLHLFPKQRRFN